MGNDLSFPRVNLKGKVVVVTGGNTGIGFQTAKWIAMLGARVIIACRSEQRATEAIEKMQAEFKIAKDNRAPNIISADSLTVEFMKLDCASLKSTAEFCEAFLAKEDQLNILICNAGIAMHPQEYTEDGYEIMFQVNYMSQFLVALKLLPVMKKSGDDCRLLMTSSIAHEFANYGSDTMPGNKMQGKHQNEDNFDRFGYYGNSKLFQIMQMYSMNERLMSTNVTVHSIHPGLVETEINRNFSDLLRWRLLFFMSSVVGELKTSYEGATTLIKAAISPEYRGARNNYYVDCKAKRANRTARNKTYQQQVWKYTLECLKDYITEDDMKVFDTPAK